jgi:VanZ family protein
VIPARWRSSAAWALLIEALILWPNPPEVPQAWTLDWLGVVKLDTLAHAGLFAVLAVLIVRVLAVESRPWWMAFAGASVFGALTEIQQHFIPSRSMELGDFLADVAGAALGLATFVAMARTRRELSR